MRSNEEETQMLAEVHGSENGRQIPGIYKTEK